MLILDNNEGTKAVGTWPFLGIIAVKMWNAGTVGALWVSIFMLEKIFSATRESFW